MVNPPSFDNVKTKWFPEIEHHCPGTPIILVGTMIDCRTNEEVLQKLARKNKQTPITPEQGQAKAKELGAARYLECSSQTKVGVQEVFQEAVRCVLKPKKKKSGGCSIL